MSMEEISNNTTDDPVTNNEKESESSSSSSGSSDEESSDEESQMEESEINHAIALATEAVSKTFGWSSNEETKSTSNNNNNNNNPLSKIIPGYTAPFSLSSSSDTQISNCKKDSIDKLIQTATTITNNRSMKRKGVVANDEVGSKNWFQYASTPITDELRTDLKILRQRNYINPKKFYKSLDNPSTHVQVGTVIEGVGEYYSSRLSKKERKANFADEIMGDYDTSNYVKQKYKKMSKTKTNKKPSIQRKNRKIKF